MNSNNENGSPLYMLMACIYCLAALLLCMILLFSSMTAHAQTLISYPLDFEVPVVDKEEYPYYGCFSSGDVNRVSDDKYTVHTYGADFYSKYPVFCVYNTVNQGYALKCYNPTTQKIEMCGSTVEHIFPIFAYHKAENQDGKEIAYQNYPSNGYWTYGTSPYVKNSSTGPNISGNGDYYFSCNVIGFDSDESAIKYYRDGDGSGIIFRPPIPDNDDDYHHDFNKDAYDADMPVPECSNFSHNGFTVNNARDDLFIFIIVESKLFGVKHSIYEQTGVNPFDKDDDAGYTFLYDSSWVYASHYYNIGDLSDIAVNKSKINIKDLWYTDNESSLVKDFKEWSEKYPSHKLLPSYKFMTHGNPFSGYQEKYEQRHVYKYSSNLSDSEQLSRSGQAQTTFHVRFYDKNMNYSRWVTYTFRNGQYTRTEQEPDDVESGYTEPDRDGNPTVPNPEKGKQDPDTGNVDYSYDIGKSTLDSSDLWATIKNLVNNMGAIPEIIGEVLSFLPSWVIYMIAAGIAACVILRFVGR